MHRFLKNTITALLDLRTHGGYLAKSRTGAEDCIPDADVSTRSATACPLVRNAISYAFDRYVPDLQIKTSF